VIRRALLLLALVLVAAPASAERLIISVSSSRVLITSSYTGAELVLFGVIERDGASVSRAGPYDIVVTVRGPATQITVREKARREQKAVAQSNFQFQWVVGAADAGVYVGQSRNVIVRNNIARKNVAGIEIENCIDADVYGNEAFDNTAGILVFALPNLDEKVSTRTNVHDNTIHDNNRDNFAEPGTVVATVPPGNRGSPLRPEATPWPRTTRAEKVGQAEGGMAGVTVPGWPREGSASSPRRAFFC
jgi:parallel beta-helix repeat protein